jgi:hypothetical protein
LNRGPVDESYQSGIPAAVQDFVQTHLQGAELSALGFRVDE